MVDIIGVLRARKLRAVKSSISFTENTDKVVSSKAKYVKSLINSDVKEDFKQNELDLAQLYYSMLDEYYAKSEIRLPVFKNKRSDVLWGKVAAACTKSGVSPYAYIKAQFDYFHKVFGKPPKLNQLFTDNAILRAQSFEDNSKQKIVGNDIAFKSNLAELLKNAEQQMQEVCRVQSLTREEVYRKFVKTGLIFFPKEYLNADPVYKRVINE